jgi:4-amino-4-deoxy-L-arabinose transferase-like glycosyltransferase
MIILTLMAFALYLYRLGQSSLRGDEAFDVLFASQSLGELLYQFRFVQPYPPLFHVGLHLWLPIAGQSEFAVRFGAALAATLVVPATFALGATFFGRKAGLVGALLAVANPFILWWGQDAHFYAYLLVTTTLLNVVALRLWRSGGYPPSKSYGTLLSGLYVLVALFSFLTHYFAYFTWGALNVVAFVESVRRRWSGQLIRRWWSAQALVVILYLPWVILTLPVTSSYVEPWIERVAPWEMLQRALTAFSLGYNSPILLPGTDAASVSAITASWLPAAFAVLFIVGIVLGWRRPKYRPALVLVLSLIFVPLAVIYIASFHRPIFDEKLSIFLLPLYLVILALGIVELARYSRWAGRLAGLAALVFMLIANYQYFTHENFAKSPAWREMIDYVNQKAQPGDLLIYNFPEPSILYYRNEELPVELIPGSAGLGADEIGTRLEQTIAGYSRVWLVPLVRPWWDANADVPAWLDRHADRVDQRFFRGVHVSLYLTPSAWEKEMTRQPATFDEGIQLRGFRISGGGPEANQPSLSPGDTLFLSLYWEADGPTDVPYTVFTHLVGPDGQLFGQWDNPPVSGTYPTTGWSPDENVVDQYQIPVKPDAPPGDYHLQVGLYDPATGARLPVLNEQDKPIDDHVRLEQEITIR